MPTQRVVLPVWGRSCILIRAVQGEVDSCTLSVVLEDAAGQPVDLTDASVRLYVEKPDGTKVFRTERPTLPAARAGSRCPPV